MWRNILNLFFVHRKWNAFTEEKTTTHFYFYGETHICLHIFFFLISFLLTTSLCHCHLRRGRKQVIKKSRKILYAFFSYSIFLTTHHPHTSIPGAIFVSGENKKIFFFFAPEKEQACSSAVENPSGEAKLWRRWMVSKKWRKKKNKFSFSCRKQLPPLKIIFWREKHETNVCIFTSLHFMDTCIYIILLSPL